MKILKSDSAAPTADPLLAVQHNISMESMLFAMEMGGLACPSVAVVRQDNPLLNFGEVSLVMGVADLPQDRSLKLYDGDAFLKRASTSHGVAHRAGFDPVRTRVMDFLRQREIPEAYDIDESVLYRKDRLVNARSRIGSMLRHSVAFRLEFLHRHGINPKIQVHPNPLRQKFLDLLQSRQVGKETLDAKCIDSALGDDSFLTQGDTIVSQYLGDAQGGSKYDADLLRAICRETLSGIKKSLVSRGFDRAAASDAINEAFRDLTLSKKFDYELALICRSVVPLESIKKGNSFSKLTLDTLVQALKGSTTGSEEVGSASIGSLESATLRQLNGPGAISRHCGKLLSASDYEAHEAMLDDLAKSFRAALGRCDHYCEFPEEIRWSPLSLLQPFVRAGETGTLTDFGRKMAARGLNLSESETQELFSPARELLCSIGEGKRSYFEGKFQRAVDISEFSVAVVPDNLPSPLVVQLRGILPDVRVYKAHDVASRKIAITQAIGDVGTPPAVAKAPTRAASL